MAPSTSPPVSAASLILGAVPWQHQLLSHLTGTIRADLPTLGSALGAVGFRSIIHYPVRRRMHEWGFFRGFDQAADLDADLRAVTEELRTLDGGRRLIWIHLHTTDLPWKGEPGEAPLDLADLYPYADPALPLPKVLRDEARRRYLEAVRRADRALGRVLEALDESGHREGTLLAISALHGIELGEHGQILYGHNLGRESIQVPLLLDLPDAWSTVPLAEHDRTVEAALRFPVELTRLWPTMVQVAGGRRLPMHPPSLFEPAAGPALSSLYLMNGVNLHSAVFPDSAVEQVVVESRFAMADPQFYLALLAQAAIDAPGLERSPRQIFEGLRRTFLGAPPWSTLDAETGESTVTWKLERWRRVRGTERVSDQEAAARRAAMAYTAWSRWLGPEETPREAR
ncbi:MAG: sulfatase-like hydrolase/transferase [Thermoanaerobaculia bacterium]|nr:sulfatase-like hydrolase/transferase [Thermoanaerobaculia bacterium]